jgi:histidinol-phosphate/aromatic aminotransferase/cobyric acid decarboxylase-like protein
MRFAVCGVRFDNFEKLSMDILPAAVLTTRVNAFWHDVQDLIKVYVSDGFDVLTKQCQTESAQAFDISHFCAPQVFRPEDLAKLQSGDMDFTDLKADETGDYFKPDGDDIYGFSLNKRLIQQSREMGIKQIFANMALRLPESIIQTNCFGPMGTVGQLVAIKKVEMHPGTSLEHLLWLEKEYSTPTVFNTTMTADDDVTLITAGQANIRLSKSPPLPVYHDVGLYVLSDDPVTSTTSYIELTNATDIPYDDIPGALPVREGLSRFFGESYSTEDLTICPDSKQAWRNIKALYEQPLVAFECVNNLLHLIDSGDLNSQVVKLSLSRQSSLSDLPLLFASAYQHGTTLFVDIPSLSARSRDFSEELRHLLASQPPPENIHLVWTETPTGDQEKTILLSKHSDFKAAFDAAAEMTWSRVSLLAQFNLMHHLTEYQIAPSVEQVGVDLPDLQADFQIHKRFESDVLESSRLGQAPRVVLDYGANRVDEKASIAKKWGIPRLSAQIKQHGFKTNRELQIILQSFFECRFHLGNGTIMTANGVSDIFNGVALYAQENNKSIAFPTPGYGEFLENAKSLLKIETYSLASGADGKLTPKVVQDYLHQYPDGVVYWNMPYPNPTGAGYSDLEIANLLTKLNQYPLATVFIDAVFLDTGELLKEQFDLSALEIPYVIATGLSKSVGGPGFRVGGCIASNKDIAFSLQQNLSMPADTDATIAYLYYDAIQKCEPELMLHLKEQSLLLQEKRQFVMKQFAQIGMEPVVNPQGGLFVAFSCSALYGNTFSDPITKQQFELNYQTLGMALQSCGLRINTPDWTGNRSIVRVVIAEPYTLLNQIPSCIDVFKKCCHQQSS